MNARDATALRERTTILLADDNEDDIELIRGAFKQADVPYQLRVVQDGQKVIQYLRGEASYANRDDYPMPFLLLLDLKMPFKSGYDVLAWIRSQGSFDHLLVVMLSASSLAADVLKADQLGTNSYLVKSPDYAQLVLFLQSLNPAP